MKVHFFVLALGLFAISCNEALEEKIDIDYSWWGEDIVYNESSQDFDLTIYYDQREFSFYIPSGDSHKFYHPSFNFHICVTNVSDSLRIKFSDGTEIKARQGDKLIYGEYTKEEKEYWADIEGKKYLEDEKYPIYHYKIHKP